MEFRTSLSPLDHQGEITHSTPLLLMGSCFTDSVGALLRDELFQVMCNPFGTIYNPASISRLLQRIAAGTRFTEDELVEAHGLHHSFMAHSSLSGASAEEVTATLNDRLDDAVRFISTASTAIVTLGTSYVYRLRGSSEVVSNCHKLPAALFTRNRLTVAEATGYMEESIDALRRLRPDIKVIFTVSPIRHTSDGLHENQLSKSTLLLAVDTVSASRPDVLYFPAYEAMMDDLRDYRFYASDMKHPSDVAVKYIHDLFATSFFNPSTLQTAREAVKLTKRLSHRRLTASQAEYEHFTNDTINMARRLQESHPELTYAITQYMTYYELFYQ